MASCFDAVHLEDNLIVSCKDVKQQGNLRCYMNSAYLAMVEIFRALHGLWVTLLPFALLWWNVMVYAMCAKYYSWNRSRQWLQTAGHRFCSTIMLESRAFSEVSTVEAREKHSSSPHQTESRADASLAAENCEMSVVLFCREIACAEAGYDVKGDAGSISHPQRKLHHGLGVAAELCMLDRDDSAIAACLEDSPPCHLNQLEEHTLCEATSHASDSFSACCDTGYLRLHSVSDINGISNSVVDGDGICSMEYDADDNDDNNSNRNVEDSGAVFDHFQFVHGDGWYGNALEIQQISTAKTSTWWDEDAVVVDKRESKDDNIEQEWQVI